MKFRLHGCNDFLVDEKTLIVSFTVHVGEEIDRSRLFPRLRVRVRVWRWRLFREEEDEERGFLKHARTTFGFLFCCSNRFSTYSQTLLCIGTLLRKTFAFVHYEGQGMAAVAPTYLLLSVCFFASE